MARGQKVEEGRISRKAKDLRRREGEDVTFNSILGSLEEVEATSLLYKCKAGDEYW